MCNKLKEVLDQDQTFNRKGFIPYIMGGDGGLQKMIEQIHCLEKLGATAIEVGVPFSDPVADGPVIQKAGLRAMEVGITLHSILAALSEERNSITIPLIIMTYANPVIRMGVDEFAEKCSQAGIAGCIIPDVPFEEERDFKYALRKRNIILIRLVPLTASLSRIKNLCHEAEGFIYAVTVNGTTGEKDRIPSTYLEERIHLVKEYTAIPVYAGFGISNVDTANELLKFSDGVIVGSKIVSSFHNENYNQIKDFAKGLERTTQLIN